MVLKILLIISILFQLTAAVVAIRLTRVTKYNAAWLLITIGLTVMALQRGVELLGSEYEIPTEVYAWTGVLTSLCFALGVFLIRKILNYIAMMGKKRRHYEERILNTIIQTEEKERMRFSKEIHDGLGPLLSSVKMSLSALDRTRLEPKQKTILENTDQVIEEAVKCLREVSNNLNPNVLVNFGLARAIGNFIKKVSGFSGMDIRYRTNLNDVRFDSNFETLLYRVVCEMVNNTLKHASASVIKLDLFLENDRIIINFEDDGIGFDPLKASEFGEGGMGLSNIRSRISSVKGELELFTSPGKGTRYRVKVHVKNTA